jgi:hypothetical protein
MEEKERKAKGPEVERERGEREENCSHGCAAVQSAFKSREQGVKALHNERTGILDLAPCNGRGAATLSIATTPPALTQTKVVVALHFPFTDIAPGLHSVVRIIEDGCCTAYYGH